jgi:hypothetical protein
MPSPTRRAKVMSGPSVVVYPADPLPPVIVVVVVVVADFDGEQGVVPMIVEGTRLPQIGEHVEASDLRQEWKPDAPIPLKFRTQVRSGFL